MMAGKKIKAVPNAIKNEDKPILSFKKKYTDARINVQANTEGSINARKMIEDGKNKRIAPPIRASSFL